MAGYRYYSNPIPAPILIFPARHVSPSPLHCHPNTEHRNLNASLSVEPHPPTPPPLPPPALFSPIAEDQRFPLIDALRGFAIFGIFLVNMTGFKSPVFSTAAAGTPLFEGRINATTLVAIEILASGKFIAMFAFLFGMGMVMQERRALAAGRKFVPFFLRRMLVLFLLGVAHGVLLWAGDVLAVYALFGLVGLLFLHCRAKTLLIWAAGMFAFVLVMLMGLSAAAAFDDGSSAGWWSDRGAWWLETYQAGTFGEIVEARLVEWGMAWGFGLFSFIPYAFVLFLLGMALGEMDFPAKLDLWRPKLRLFAVIAFPTGLAASLLYATIYHWNLPVGIETMGLGMAGYVVGMALLALAYASAFALIVWSGRAPALVGRLAAVGRLALTNYLLQSVVANILFMSWGFGLYGKVDALTGVLIVIIVFILQLLLSPVWLCHFQIGPIEWIWRALSYGSLPALRRRAQ